MSARKAEPGAGEGNGAAPAAAVDASVDASGHHGRLCASLTPTALRRRLDRDAEKVADGGGRLSECPHTKPMGRQGPQTGDDGANAVGMEGMEAEVEAPGHPLVLGRDLAGAMIRGTGDARDTRRRVACGTEVNELEVKQAAYDGRVSDPKARGEDTIWTEPLALTSPLGVEHRG